MPFYQFFNICLNLCSQMQHNTLQNVSLLYFHQQSHYHCTCSTGGHSTASTMFDRLGGKLWIMSLSCPSPYPFSIILFHMLFPLFGQNLACSVQIIMFPNREGLFLVAFLFLRVTSPTGKLTAFTVMNLLIIELGN